MYHYPIRISSTHLARSFAPAHGILYAHNLASTHKMKTDARVHIGGNLAHLHIA